MTARRLSATAKRGERGSGEDPNEMAERNDPARPFAGCPGRPLRIAAFISGGGTTVVNLRAVIGRGELDAEIVAVLADRDAAGLGRCRDLGLPAERVSRRAGESVTAFSERLFARADAAGADVVALAGFLALLAIPAWWRLRVLNIHPSLIPAFCGKGMHGRRVHAAALGRGVTVSGCTVHFADDDFDHGPILLQRTVPVRPDDDADTLAARVFEAECEAYPEALRRFASGRLEVVGRRVRLA